MSYVEAVCWLRCCFTSTKTVGLLGTGAQDVHLDFHTAPGLWGNRQHTGYNSNRSRHTAGTECPVHLQAVN